MNKYLIEILKIVIKHKCNVTLEEIADEMSISKRRVSYYLDQLDFYLCQNGLKRVELTPSHNVDERDIESYEKYLQSLNIKEYIFSSDERKNIVVLNFLIFSL